MLIYGQNNDIYYSRLQGEVDSSYILTANIIRLDENVSGTFNYKDSKSGAYPSYSKSIPLNGKVSNDTVNLKQLGSDDDLLMGVINRSTFSGYWNFDDNSEYPVSMIEIYPKGSMPFDVHYLRSEEKLFRDSLNTPIAEIELTLLFPVLIPDSSRILDSIRKHITESFFGKREYNKNPDSLLTHFELEYYTNYIDQNTDIYSRSGASFNWQKILNMSVINNSNSLLCLEYLKYAYTGGAHGMTNMSYSNIDLVSGINYTYDDVFKEGSDSLLTQVLTRKLYTDRQIPHDISLTEAGYFVNHIEPNHNIFINNNGIGFLYNSYEVAPYSMGQTTIFIEFHEIYELLKEGNSIYRLATQKAL